MIWTREALFGEKYTEHELQEFISECPPVEWQHENPMWSLSEQELVDELHHQKKWRHHHGIESLKDTPDLYGAYALRVDAMLEQLDGVLQRFEVDPLSTSFLDIAAAEGYVTNHLFEHGAKDVDAVDLNEGNIRRIWMVRAVKQISGGRVGRLDLNYIDWSRSLGRTYDVALALGIVYHLENPMLFLRNLFALTERLAIIESDTPVFPENVTFRGYGAIYLHRDQVTLNSGNIRYLTEMRPDRQALAEMLISAGFSEVHAIDPPPTHRSRYVDSGEKTMLVAIK